MKIKRENSFFHNAHDVENFATRRKCCFEEACILFHLSFAINQQHFVNLAKTSWLAAGQRKE